MFPSVALQATAIAVAVMMTGPAATDDGTKPETTQAVRMPAAPEPTRLRCRLYFGCAPASQTVLPTDRI